MRRLNILLISCLLMCSCENLFKQLTGLRSHSSPRKRYVTSDFSQGMGKWHSHSTVKQFGSYVSLQMPYKWIDDNHIDKMGHLLLTLWAYTSSDLNGNPLIDKPDLTNKQITITLRGDNFKPRGSDLVFWLSSQINPWLMNEPGWQRANWAYTGRPLTEFLLDGEWHKVSFILKPDRNFWTYAGNNKHQGNRERYSYKPLDESLAEVNVDILFVLYNVDPNDLPEGSIEVKEIVVEY